MENSFKSLIDQSNSVLILLPAEPAFDQVAAGLSLYLVLKNNKSVSLSCPTPMTVEFNRLVGVDKISRDLGNKNLIIKFADYEANDIERVSYDIDDRQFRLTVIPKTGIQAPVKEQIDLSYSGVSCDTVILIGGTEESQFPALTSKDLEGAKIAHVGIKDLRLGSQTPVLSFARPASSLSEMVALLMKDSGLTPDGDVATNLLMGIEEGSDKYRSTQVNADTFEIVSELMRAGGKRLAPLPMQRVSYPQGSIPGRIPTGQPQTTLSRLQTQQQALSRAQMQPQPAPDQMPIQRQPNVRSSQLHPQPEDNQSEQRDNRDGQRGNQEEVPKDWLKTPRVYRGTSTS